MISTWLAPIVLLLLLAWFPIPSWLRRKRSRNVKPLPPGPRGIPFLGNLHMLGAMPHRDLHKLSKQHGPIMFLRLGRVPTVVVSSPQAAKLFLKTNDLVFASRPPSEASKYLSYGQKGLAFSPYGTYWRETRKMCTLDLLNTNKITSFAPMRKQDVNNLISSIREAANDRAAVDVSAKVSALSAEITCRMVFGKKYEDKDLHERGFAAVVQEVMKLTAAPNFGDYIPQLRVLDVQGLKKRLRDVAKDMLGGGMDTSATVIEWIMSELLERLNYLYMVVKETLRVHPIVPLLIPHASTEDCTVEGFHIPERFVDSNVDLRGRDFELLPFGSGRRSCPGMQLGLIVVRLVVAQLVHCFDWELPDGMLPSDLDMTEEFSLVTPRAKHLLAVPAYRLRPCPLPVVVVLVL